MTYEKIFETMKKNFEKAKVSNLKQDFAFQFNITGEGEGIFYVAFKDGKLSIEPYDYKDRDVIFTADGKTLTDISAGKLEPIDAIKSGKLTVDGNDLSKQLMNLIPAAKADAKKTAPKKDAKPAAKKAAAKPAPKAAAPAAKPATPAAKAAAPAAKPAAAPVKAAVPAVKPVETTAKAATPAVKPVEATAKAAVPAVKPAEAAKPVASTASKPAATAAKTDVKATNKK